MKKLFRLLQFTDSAFPVGTFSFSNGLETASQLGIVHNVETLKSFTYSVALQAAFTDGIAALMAYRACCNNEYEGVCAADRQIMLFKLNEEARLMLTRMGKKLAELGVYLYGTGSMFKNWLLDIKDGKTPGSYPIAQALAFGIEDLGEKELFLSHQYGVINMILQAALRCVRVSHYDTQKILFEIGQTMESVYEQARTMNFENMNSFVPEMDIFASLHEKGKMRMFMN